MSDNTELNIKREASFESYRIIQKKDNSINVYLEGEYVGEGNNKELLRKIAKEIKMNWTETDTTQSLGNKVLNALLGNTKEVQKSVGSEQFMLTITADEVSSTDSSFTMGNIYLGDLYKPVDTYLLKADGSLIRRIYNKGERRNTNQTMPRIAFQVFESLIDKLTIEEKVDFPICQYTPESEIVRGIYASIDEFKKYKNSIEYLVYKVNEKDKYVIYCWNIFSTILFVKECLSRFGESDDKFILTYVRREQVDANENTNISGDMEVLEVNFEDYTTGGVNRIYYGAPGTGKSWAVKEYVSENYNKSWRTTFHPEYTYFDFVGGLKPVQNRETRMISYDYYAGPFTESLVYAYKHPDEKVALIVEEINRANTAAVFGDIFQLLDRDNDGKSEYGIHNRELLDYLENEQGISLPNSEIIIPSNYSIVATMNSADQGVFVMDSAFKRRWEFEYTPIDFTNHSDIGDLVVAGFNVSWRRFAENLNDYLSSIGIPEDKLIGPRFLKKNDIQNKRKISSKLLIYLWDDVVRYKRGDLFEEKSRFSKVVADFENGKKIFKKELHDKMKSTNNNDEDSISEE